MPTRRHPALIHRQQGIAAVQVPLQSAASWHTPAGANTAVNLLLLSSYMACQIHAARLHGVEIGRSLTIAPQHEEID